MNYTHQIYFLQKLGLILFSPPYSAFIYERSPSSGFLSLRVCMCVRAFVCVCAGGESHLVVLQRSRVERPTQEELSYHTSQRPHVYGLTKWQAQNNLWSPAERKEKEKVTPGSCSPSIITNRSYWHNPENNKISMDWQEWKGWDRCSFCWMELKIGWTGMFMRTKR